MPESLLKKSSNIIKENADLYWINGWGEGYFQINENGEVVIKPKRNEETINLYELVTSLVQRGIEPPILFRFDGIIKDRIKRIYNSFNQAIEEYEYKNSYQMAYPIKVNQQKHVVDIIRTSGTPHQLSLEVGSKPELLAVLSIHDSEDTLILCNGYKDVKYIELALLSRKIGRRPIIIIEQFYELKLILEISKKLNIEAEIGIRIKPHSKGSGKWASSGGSLAKFGLSYHEINLTIEQLIKEDKTHYLKLIHFHIGSQLTSIIPLKKALRESSRMYVEIAKRCPSICFFDVGGGLGVDYDGSKTTADSSMNYTIEQYARDVVYTIGSLCEEEKIPQPTIISESGRAITAHHSILVTEAIDVSPIIHTPNNIEPPPSDHPILQELYETYNTVKTSNCMEALHDCSDLQESAIEQLIQGEISLEEKAYVERISRHLTSKILQLAKKLKFIPEEIQKLDDNFLDMYFCNFSVFQSIPDAWAIQQLFPVMPIHRLNTTPDKKATIVDLTCDSDGIINQFVSYPKNLKWTYLHELNSSPYYIGIFLVGAYQETLGGLHNLFGDTNAVHVDINEQGNWELKHLIEGDTIKEVLSYVQYSTEELITRLRSSIEKALRKNHLSLEESATLMKHFKKTLESYTYLVV